jgi:hypothetical protein
MWSLVAFSCQDRSKGGKSRFFPTQHVRDTLVGRCILSPEPSAVIPALIQMARALCAASSGSGGLSALSPSSLSNHHLRAALSSTTENFNGTGQHDPMNVLDSLFLKTADPSDVTGFGPCPEDCSRLAYYYHRSTAAQKVRD